MCLSLLIGTGVALPECENPDLLVEAASNANLKAKRWFSQPSIQYVGAHTGCSCGFPSVVAANVIEYFDGMWDDHDERDEDIRSVSALLKLLGDAFEASDIVELFPVWEGNEERPPKGVVEWSLRQLVPERMFFNEHYLHVVRR